MEQIQMGDRVEVIAGKERGRQGRVIQLPLGNKPPAWHTVVDDLDRGFMVEGDLIRRVDSEREPTQ